jgi:hypothetical protein
MGRPELLVATQFFAGRTMLYPHAALDYDPQWYGQKGTSD